ncbi:MAG: rmlD [Parachlamydiales bacterium]|nr:rmlD [Parachlamydiales bacterium]
MRVWITGAKGLLGSALQQALLARGVEFVGTSKSDADVTDLSSLAQFYRKMGPFTHLIHCAAYTQVDLAESQPELARQVNALAPALIGSLAAEMGFRVVHISTDYVFDGLSSHPYLESDRIAPQTVYGQTKAEGETHLLAALPDACIIRTSWLFGMGPKHFVSTMIRLMLEKEEVAVVSDQRGRPTYAPDLAEAVVQALDWSGIYHVASSGKTSWHAFAEVIGAEALALNLPVRCRYIKPVLSLDYGAPAPRPLYSVLDTTKADEKLGKPLRHWKDGLKEYLLKTYA